MKRRSLGLLATAATVALLIGCGAGGADAQREDEPDFVHTDVYGTATGELESLTWNIADGEPSSLNPIFSANVPARSVLPNICDQLLIQNEDFEIVPYLATPSQADPTTVVLDLVEGATFWNGDPVTAEDVVFSMRQNMRPDAQNASVFANVSDVVATSPFQVTVTLTRPDELFVKQLGSSAGSVWSKAYAEAAGDSYGTAEGGVMCSGPFELDTWNQGTSIILKKNENYWNPDLSPKVDEVRLSFVIDTSAVAQGILAGEFDGVWQVDTAGLDALRTGTGGQIVQGSSIAQWTLAIASPDGVTDDPLLRRAMFGVIDRPAIVEAVRQGVGEPAYTLLAPNYWDEEGAPVYREAYAQYEEANTLSIDEAKKLVEASSYNGETLRLAFLSGDENNRLFFDIYQQRLAEIGVTLEPYPMEGIAFMTATYTPEARKDFDLITLSSFGSALDPLEFLNFFIGPGEAYNYTDFEHPAVTAGLQEALGTFDDEERARILADIQQHWEAELPMSVIYMPEILTWVRDGIGGVTTSTAYLNQPSLAFMGADEG